MAADNSGLDMLVVAKQRSKHPLQAASRKAKASVSLQPRKEGTQAA